MYLFFLLKNCRLRLQSYSGHVRLDLFCSDQGHSYQCIRKARFEASCQIGMLFLLHITAISCWSIRVTSCCRDSCKNSLTAPSLVSNLLQFVPEKIRPDTSVRFGSLSNFCLGSLAKFLKIVYKNMVSGCGLEP